MTKPSEKPHRISFRVYYEDTDAAGIIYHANFVKFAERGRTDFLRDHGYNHMEIADKFGVIFVVRHVTVDFKASGKLDDWLDTETFISAVGNTSLTFQQTVSRDGKNLAELKVVVVAITREGRAVRIPPQLRQIFGEISSGEPRPA